MPTALNPGDIAIVGFRSGAPDGIAFVTFKDLDAGTMLGFTDASYQEPNPAASWRGSENFAIWTASSVVPAGTVVVLSFPNTPPSTTDNGTVSNAGLNGISASGDQIFVYQRNDGTVSTSSPFASATTATTWNAANGGTLLFGINVASAGGFITTGTVNLNSTNNSYIPDAGSGAGSLTLGSTALNINASGIIANAQYNGSRNGLSIADFKTQILNQSNWTAVDAATGTLNSADLTVATGFPTVNLSVSTTTGTEVGATVITVTATASSVVTGSQTIALGVTGTNITTGDYTLSSPTITIPNGQTTGSATFTVVDDVLVEGSETAVLTISSPSAGITLGSTTTQNLTIADNESGSAVNLSVSSNAGSEANTTAITVTAIAASAVTGNQTVALGVSGAGITASDYYLTNSTIAIASGQTSGSVTFIVADDTIAEGAETAVLTLGATSSGLTLGSTIAQNITIANNDSSFLKKVGGILSANGAEIPAFDPGSDRLFVVAGTVVETYIVSATGALTAASPLVLGFTPPAGTETPPNSVAVKNGIVAVAYAVQNSTTKAQQSGRVSFYDAASGAFLNSVEVGFLPDMLTFTPDGTKVLVANEGEPNSYGVAGTSFDPEGSVSVINIASGVASATVQNASFTSFNDQITSLKAAGVRITGPGSTVAQDLEPEYIAVAPDGLTARITLQENNAIAILDIPTATITSVQSLGTKNHNLPGNGFDASDRDLTSSAGKINIQNWPVFGLYQPDAIASYSVNGQTYYITANEGDARDYTGFSEEIRVGAAGYVLDPTTFPNATTLKANGNLGRLQLTNATGDTNGDGDFDRIEAFGARSFSIWNAAGAQVFDSGDQLETITAAKTPTLFNSDGLAASFDTRSDNKGPEPEGVTIGLINNRTYAFIGIERSGDVMVYDVSNPIAPTFVQYINTPEDIGTEGLTFVSAADSPTGKPLLITANEISKTVGVFEVMVPPRISDIQGSGATATAGTFTIEGIVVGDFQGENQLGGFYLQEEDSDADGNVLTSEGIFVNSTFAVNFGDRVRITGTVQENTATPSFNQAVIVPSTLQITGTNLQSLVTPTMIDLPTVNLGDLERYEAMLVTFPETLTVTETFNLGRFGEVVLSANGRLFNPTNLVDPNDNPASGTSSTGRSNVDAVTALQNLNNRSRIILDDGSSASNLSDVPYIDTTDANPLNDTLRIGSTVNNLTGVLGYGFNQYRLQATQAPAFDYAARPGLPTVGGNVKVASFNVLNYFNGDGLSGGFPTARGADSTTEFARQRAKIIAAIQELNADVVGLIEMENDGDGPDSAIADLVNGLNAATAPGTYAAVPLASTTGSPGTDAIKVAFIYKPSAVSTVGNAQYFNDPAFTSLGRPPLAQTFRLNATGETFTPIVNHFKSKSAGGATGLDIDQNDGQGAFNATRKTQATALLSFVGQIQTASGDSDVMILGDLNAYNEEDPIDILRAGGFTKLTTATDSYVFDGQTGSLDHALVSASLRPQVTGAAKWNINADEPITFDYNDNIQTMGTNGEQTSELRNDTSLYTANPFRSSDHDPVLVGLNLQATFNAINGTSRRDTLGGTSGRDRITGGLGGDTLTGGAGGDEFVYTNLRDVGDTITDFEIGADKLVFTNLLDSLVSGGYGGTNAIADGYVKVIPGSAANRFNVQIDADGLGAASIFRPYITVDVSGAGSLNATSNFLF